MEGPDHAASLEFDEFFDLVKGLRQVEEALGTKSTERKFSQGEMINRENLGKSLVASKEIKTGDIISEQHIKIVSPGQGLSPQYKNELIGNHYMYTFEKDESIIELIQLSESQNKTKAEINLPFKTASEDSIINFSISPRIV